MVLLTVCKKAVPLQAIEDRGHEVADCKPAGFGPGAVASHSIGDHEDLSDGISRERCFRGDAQGGRVELYAAGEFTDEELVLVFGSNQSWVGQSAGIYFDGGHFSNSVLGPTTAKRSSLRCLKGVV